MKDVELPLLRELEAAIRARNEWEVGEEVTYEVVDCDLGPEECHGCRVDTALTALEEYRKLRAEA